MEKNLGKTVCVCVCYVFLFQPSSNLPKCSKLPRGADFWLEAWAAGGAVKRWRGGFHLHSLGPNSQQMGPPGISPTVAWSGFLQRSVSQNPLKIPIKNKIPHLLLSHTASIAAWADESWGVEVLVVDTPCDILPLRYIAVEKAGMAYIIPQPKQAWFLITAHLSQMC